MPTGASGSGGGSFSILLTTNANDQLQRVSVGRPRRDGGSVSYPFPQREPLDWFGRTKQTVMSADGVFRISMTKVGQASWVFEYARQTGIGPPGAVTEGVIKLSASSPVSPNEWRSWTFDADLRLAGNPARFGVSLQFAAA